MVWVLAPESTAARAILLQSWLQCETYGRTSMKKQSKQCIDQVFLHFKCDLKNGGMQLYSGVTRLQQKDPSQVELLPCTAIYHPQMHSRDRSLSA